MRRTAALFAGLLLLSGCGTIDSAASGCYGPASGWRFDGDLLGAYGAEMLAAREVELGVDGWLADAWDTVFVALDLPLSALADAASAPIALARGQAVPEPVGLGCRWAAPRLRWGSVASADPDDDAVAP
jgi:uncharacterized protein YceK